MRRSLLVAVAGAGALAVVATLAVTGEWPDPARSIDLLTGRSVTAQTEVAFVALLGWVAAIALTLLVTVAELRQRRSERMASASTWSLVVLVVGIALLVAGIARHTGYRVCCASPVTTQQAADLVR